MKKIIFYGLLGILLGGKTLRAQFSPGDLTNAHANLEGMNNCTQCHDLGKKINGEKCLECHALIKSRMNQSKGFHGSAAVRSKECIQCHTEHRGRGFDMIKWAGDRASFDHSQSGYMLEGKHKPAKCEACHRPENIRDAAVRNRSNDGLSLAKTYLGLSRDCGSCHFDEHRNHFKKPCSQCHDFEDWKRSAETKFDHSTTRFPLTGRHSLAQCVQCHTLIPDTKKKPDGQTDTDYMNFTDLVFDKCTACHKDPHNNKFGQDCKKCHVPGGWQSVTVSGFDHSKTNFALTGAHLAVTCEKCHQPDVAKKAVYKNIKHNACADCHKDVHAGQFSSRTDKGKCDACHSTNGYIPSLFSPIEHNQLRFKLSGSHMAVACDQCHVKLSGHKFNAMTGTTINPAELTEVFRFSGMACADCHADIHKGQFKEKIDREGCEACHRPESWTELKFDHNKDSKFPLNGKHAGLTCQKCHNSSSGKKSEIEYTGLSSACESCHADIHFGQLAEPGKSTTPCARCHSESGFKPVIFDHTTQSRFSLTGSHQKVECSKCHIPVTLNNGSVTIVYKPIETKCSSCHANLK